MFIKLCVILTILSITVGENENHDWDLAVVINDQIELLQSNGSLIGSTQQQFRKLKAVTFDNVRHQFLVSDMDINRQNDTIFAVQLTKETDIMPIIQDLPDDVQGLAIDPITDTLYWTDYKNGTINYVSLNDTTFESKVLLAFADQSPLDIAVDICRRYIYWTNSDFNRPSIERARLDGTDHEVLIDSDLYMPSGVAIDYKAHRLYWADMREGIYYRIESTNLDGKEREIVFEGTHSKPFGITVDDHAIYWTDINNNALWRISKYKSNSVPEKLRDFEEKPMGLVAKNVQITSLPDCHKLAETIKNYNQSTVEMFMETTDNENNKDEITECLNNGLLISNTCKCRRGYTGKYCEIAVCHNFCVHGSCHLSSLGYPLCRCPNGFGGKRCEQDMCEGFCLNNGVCEYNNQKSKIPKCNCRHNFAGQRCEASVNISDICKLFCQENDNDELVINSEHSCRCERGTYRIEKVNATSPTHSSLLRSRSDESYLEMHLEDPTFIIMASLMILMLFSIIILSSAVCSLRRRPRIKKRIIVNKNVTPLTYRPQSTEHCEITIENCCNMNVCETPCFEPPQLRGLQNSKNDDKKNLLSNMENGNEDYY